MADLAWLVAFLGQFFFLLRLQPCADYCSRGYLWLQLGGLRPVLVVSHTSTFRVAYRCLFMWGKLGVAPLKPLQFLENATAHLAEDARFVFEEVHLRFVQRMQKNRVALVTIRDPVERIISAFNWKRHRCRVGKQHCSSTELKLFDCYDSTNSFAENLFEPDACGNISRSELSGHASSGHIGRGIAWYFRNLSFKQLKCQLYVVHSETLATDFQGFLEFIGRSDLSHLATKPLRARIHSTYSGKNDTFVSELGLRNFRQALTEEYGLYNELTKGSTPSSRGCPPPAAGNVSI